MTIGQYPQLSSGKEAERGAESRGGADQFLGSPLCPCPCPRPHACPIPVPVPEGHPRIAQGFNLGGTVRPMSKSRRDGRVCGYIAVPKTHLRPSPGLAPLPEPRPPSTRLA